VQAFDAAWRNIRDTHFDKTFNGLDWNAVGNELRPKAACAATDAELRAVIEQMLARLKQSHFYLIPREANRAADVTPPAPGTLPAPRPVSAASGDVGIDVRLVGRTAVVVSVRAESSAARARVRAGWLLNRVDDLRVGELVAGRAPLPGRPGTAGMRNRIAEALKGAPGSTVETEFLDEEDAPVVLRLERNTQPGETVQFGNLPPLVARLEHHRIDAASGLQVGVISFNVWMAPLVRAFDAAIDQMRDVDGMVIDLRGNPGGMGAMIMGLAGHFVHDRISLGTMTMRDNELSFVANPRLVNPAGERVDAFAGPLAVLVDDMSGSASEIFAGGLQAIGRARVFGEVTMGAVLPAMFERLPNGDVMAHAVADFVTPAGVRLEGRGVIPDERISLTRTDLLSNRDAPLDAALAWIGSQARTAGGATRNP
jgi:carboxyl-terminal processing protease